MKKHTIHVLLITLLGVALMWVHPALGAVLMAGYVIYHHQFRDRDTAPFWACCAAGAMAMSYAGMEPWYYFFIAGFVYVVLARHTIENIVKNLPAAQSGENIKNTENVDNIHDVANNIN